MGRGGCRVLIRGKRRRRVGGSGDRALSGGCTSWCGGRGARCPVGRGVRCAASRGIGSTGERCGVGGGGIPRAAGGSEGGENVELGVGFKDSGGFRYGRTHAGVLSYMATLVAARRVANLHSRFLDPVVRNLKRRVGGVIYAWFIADAFVSAGQRTEDNSLMHQIPRTYSRNGGASVYAYGYGWIGGWTFVMWLAERAIGGDLLDIPYTIGGPSGSPSFEVSTGTGRGGPRRVTTRTVVRGRKREVCDYLSREPLATLEAVGACAAELRASHFVKTAVGEASGRHYEG
ncbi:hypothetical protein K438DRAFT_1762578 [Mycena galopus ATCC 62051]|nr:hypothetical protein K438DRAFT_1762578 [Mycena galopus ATCC 62051]